MKRITSWIAAAALISATAAAGAQEGHAPAHSSLQACNSPGAWSVFEGERLRSAGAAELLSGIAKRDVVLLGEHHDEDDHHRWQLQTLAALHTMRPNMAIGFEMFPRRVQPVLDRWVAGDLTVKQFLQQSEWDQSWTMPAELYLPLFQFARINRIPMLALNIDQKLSKAIAAKGWDAVPEADREGVGRAAPPVEAYLDMLFQSYREHSSPGGKDRTLAHRTDPAFRYFVESQTAWDRAMAEVLARRAPNSAGDKPLMVGIMGSGHIRFGYGVPHQLRELGVKNVGTLIPLHVGSDCKQLTPGLADAVFMLPKQASAKPDPPRLGVTLADDQGSLRIVQVTTGSLAERTGLKSGDRLLEVGGVPAKKISSVIASIRQQPAGSWLPMRVQRRDATLELVVKFPHQP